MRTGEHPVLAILYALSTGADFPGNGATSTRLRISFVRRSIAVVIEAVADLRRRLRILDANNAAVRAIRRPRRANPELPGVAGHIAPGIAFVGRAVAVVVLVVAGLGRRHRRRITHEHASRARQCARRANAGLTRHTRAAAPGTALVDITIAIVVDSVANLGRRRSGRTRLHHAARTSLHRHLTRAHAARGHAEPIVDEKIAIVVDTIARFSLRLPRRTRLRHAVDTRRNRIQTRPRPACRVAKVLVDRSVAVIVEFVARFHCGNHFALTRAPRPARARLHTRLAFTHADGAIAARITRPLFAFRRTRTIDPIVDFAVAIFVRPVTRLGFRHSGHTRGDHTAGASFHHHLAGAFSTGLAGKTIIDAAIAIFVDTVARLHPGQHLPHTSAPLLRIACRRAGLALPDIFGPHRSRITRLGLAIDTPGRTSPRAALPRTARVAPRTTAAGPAPGPSNVGWYRRFR